MSALLELEPVATKKETMTCEEYARSVLGKDKWEKLSTPRRAAALFFCGGFKADDRFAELDHVEYYEELLAKETDEEEIESLQESIDEERNRFAEDLKEFVEDGRFWYYEDIENDVEFGKALAEDEGYEDRIKGIPFASIDYQALAKKYLRENYGGHIIYDVRGSAFFEGYVFIEI